MHYERPIVMSIAGFDPSGGAGLLADIKTIEQHQCLGFGVATAWTVQTEITFLSVNWMSLENILEQAAPLLESYPVKAIKIGIVESLETLLALVLWLKEKAPNVPVIWDTVRSASTGFLLTETGDQPLLQEILKNVYLITPNIPEALKLSGTNDERVGAKYLSNYCNVLLKGGHSTTAPGVDILLTEKDEFTFLPAAKALSAKHGSGCILSSAIAANLASGIPLELACSKAKEYIETILGSNQNKLAYHYV